ncbi:MAG: hypothetical protein QW117_03400, partial [Candidatus Pacearchaeota archaeon]
RVGSMQQGSNSFYFQGNIDEVYIYNRSLSADEIKQLYYSNLYKYEPDKWQFITNQSNLSVGTYTYQGFAKDTLNNVNQTEERQITINVTGGEEDITPPVVTLVSPENATSTINITINFVCNATDDIGLSNITLYIWNSTDLIYTNTTLVSGTYNETSWDYTLPYRGEFKWNCYACDNSSNCNFASTNYSLTILKFASINITYPINGTALPRGNDSISHEDDLQVVKNDINIIAKVYDNSNLEGIENVNCSFYFDNELIGTSLTNSTGYCNLSYNKVNKEFGWHNITVNYTELPTNYYGFINITTNQLKIENWTLQIDIVNYRTNSGTYYYVDDIAGVNITIKRDNQLKNATNITLILSNNLNQNLQIIYIENLTYISEGKYYFELVVPNINWLRWKAVATYDFEGTGEINATSSQHTDVQVNQLNALLNTTATKESDELFENTTIKFFRHGLIGRYLLQEREINSTFPWNSRSMVLGDNFYDVEFEMPDSYKLIISKINISSSYLTLKTQSANYTGTIPGIARLSKVIAANISNFEKATLYFVKEFEPTKICRCEDWNFISNSCYGTWQCNSTSDYEYGSNSSHFWFNVSGFTGYAGGVGYNANLTIYDSNDTEGGGNTIYVNQQAIFYANYTNSTSGQSINGSEIYCEITFNVSGGWTNPENMSFNSSSLLYEYNRSFNEAGTFNWNVTCDGSSLGYDALIANDTILIIQEEQDTTPPTITIIYPQNISYNINISELNYTYQDDNPGYCWYSKDNGNTNSSSVIAGTNFTNIISTEGTNTWTLYCNDTAGNENSTSITFFKDTIYPLISFVEPTTSSGIHNQNYIDVNVTASDDNLDTITIYLYNSTGLVNSTSSQTSPFYVKFTNLQEGTYYINATVNDTLNNINSTETRTIILDTIPPQLTIISPANITYNTNTIDFNITADENLDSCLYTIDNWQTNISMTKLNDTYFYNITQLNDGSYTAKFWCNDTSGNINDTEQVGFSIDATPPYFTYIPPSPYNIYDNESLDVDFNATDETAFDCFAVNDTTNFAIDCDGRLINITALSIGTYNLNITINDTSNNLNSTIWQLEVLDSCIPNLVNTTWSDWYNITECRVNNTILQERNLTQYDENDCNEIENQTFYDYREIECDYCTPNLVNTTKSEWQNIGCVGYDMNQSRYWIEYDENDCNEIENKTYYDYRLLYADLIYTEWTNWTDVGCVGNDMNQSRYRIQYDANNVGCFENQTEYDYRILEALLQNTTKSDWQDVGCVGNDLNQSRYWIQYDVNNVGCYNNETFYEYQLLEADIKSTEWTDWQDVGCIGEQMNQSRSRKWYDANNLGCYENNTEYDYRLDGPILQNTSWSSWENLGCIGTSGYQNESRYLIEYDLYSCRENITYYEYRQTYNESCLDLTPPSISFILPTENNGTIIYVNSTMINVSVSENVSSCILIWDPPAPGASGNFDLDY